LRKAILFPADIVGKDGKPSGRKIATNLTDCDLRAADFSGADLRFARLLNAKTTAAKFTGAKLDQAELPPGTKT
jgi:uncharacterized protein YjbI with pentapeptide repeats